MLFKIVTSIINSRFPVRSFALFANGITSARSTNVYVNNTRVARLRRCVSLTHTHNMITFTKYGLVFKMLPTRHKITVLLNRSKGSVAQSVCLTHILKSNFLKLLDLVQICPRLNINKTAL